MLENLEAAAFTDTGKTRKNNQDALHVDRDLGFVIVADGMGGHKAGEVASAIAVDAVSRYLAEGLDESSRDEMQTLLRLGSSVEYANRLIRQEAIENPELEGMATTIVVALFRDGRVYRAHVGDSRLYRYRHGHLQQLTKDHSLLQYLVDKGVHSSIDKALQAGVGANMLTRGLGVDDQIEVDVTDDTVEAEDVYLLCTDGLTGMLSDSYLEKLIELNRHDIYSAAEQMMVEALEAGGTDNVSVVLCEPFFSG